MEPLSKRRRLAPKIEVSPTCPPHQPRPLPVPASTPTLPLPLPLPLPSPASQLQAQNDFEAFARHLQDAAMHVLQQRRQCHTSVSVLMLRWEDDVSVEPDLLALDKVFRHDFHYHTDRWLIPSVAKPSMELGVRMASFLDKARPDHLLVVYYAGHGQVAADQQLYWAASPKKDTSRLNWDGVRCLLEEVQSDLLLLLDTCAVRDAALTGRHGAKQVMAAYTPDRQPTAARRSFTAVLTDALRSLGTGLPFDVQTLYLHMLALARHENTEGCEHENPLNLMLNPAQGQSLTLAPLSPASDLQSPPRSAGQGQARENQAPGATMDGLTFEDARVLACTTFVGDASPDMEDFNHWLRHRPPMAAEVTVEGIFLGPPTMLLISMPTCIWEVVQHDKVCCFLGHIKSHNMTHLYQQLVHAAPVRASQEVNVRVGDGRVSLEAREAASSAEAVRQKLPDEPDDLAVHVDATPPYKLHDWQPGHPSSPLSWVAPRDALPSLPVPRPSPEQTVEPIELQDSAEMQEAAEQLKALSHRRDASDGTLTALALAPPERPGRPERPESPETPERPTASCAKKKQTDNPTSSSQPKTRKPLENAAPRREMQCPHCTHAVLEDVSSLRRHVAAAHTRPFPCAFAFASCASTFGSKNEWKRHMSSQHLCLQVYRCSACPLVAASSSGGDSGGGGGGTAGKGNEFNRKDLFTQHLRRMHAPAAIKKAFTVGSSSGDGKLQAEWDAQEKEMQLSCRVTRRKPPQHSACPKPGCHGAFEGPGSWDDWTEHVGRHMEKGEADQLGVDDLLRAWALKEGIIERREDGSYRCCTGGGGVVETVEDGGVKASGLLSERKTSVSKGDGRQGGLWRQGRQGRQGRQDGKNQDQPAPATAAPPDFET